MAGMNDPRLHPLHPVARSFSRLPRHLNPVTNPAAKKNFSPDLQRHVDAIAAHPELSAVASGASQDSGPPTGGSGSSFGAGGVGNSLMPNQSQFKRLPDVRHNICGMPGVVFGAAGTATGTFSPQTRFKPNRLLIPSGTLAGTTISNMLVGTRPQYAASSVEPFHMFEEQSTAGVWDMDVCEIGQKITMSVTVTGATTVYSCLIGE